jgi:histidine ammonia-lyase
MTRPVVQLDGRTLGCGQVRDIAWGTADATVTSDGRERARAAARVAAEVAARSPVYGRTTGVGANRDQAVSPADVEGHGLRLLRSHAGGGGPLIAAELSRAMLVVRASARSRPGARG